MNPSRSIACGAFALLATLLSHASFAADPSQDPSPTRAQVRQAAIDARKAGQLHVGDDPNYPYGRDAAVLKPARTKAKKTRGAAKMEEATASK